LERRHYINETARLSMPQKSWSLIGQINSCARLPISCEQVRKLCARLSKSWAWVSKSCTQHKIL